MPNRVNRKSRKKIYKYIENISTLTSQYSFIGSLSGRAYGPLVNKWSVILLETIALNAADTVDT